MFFRKKEVENHAKKFDKLITGLIIGGAVASMIGLSKTDKGKKITENVKKEGTNISKKGYKIFGKTLVSILKLINKK
ncbi:MAG: hypothetical protein QM490_05075 [Candidatus Gracilibacteria bacterium]